MATRLAVVYTDGTTEEIPLRPIGFVAAERQYGGKPGHLFEVTLYAGWFVKGKPGPSFDEWVATLEDVEEKSEDTRPLDEEPSPDESPTSQ